MSVIRDNTPAFPIRGWLRFPGPCRTNCYVEIPRLRAIGSEPGNNLPPELGIVRAGIKLVSRRFAIGIRLGFRVYLPFGTKRVTTALLVVSIGAHSPGMSPGPEPKLTGELAASQVNTNQAATF